jgi:hypothetical protein
MDAQDAVKVDLGVFKNKGGENKKSPPQSGGVLKISP